MIAALASEPAEGPLRERGRRSEPVDAGRPGGRLRRGAEAAARPDRGPRAGGRTSARRRHACAGSGQGQDGHRTGLGLCARRRALRRPGPARRSVPLSPTCRRPVCTNFRPGPGRPTGNRPWPHNLRPLAARQLPTTTRRPATDHQNHGDCNPREVRSSPEAYDGARRASMNQSQARTSHAGRRAAKGAILVHPEAGGRVASFHGPRIRHRTAPARPTGRPRRVPVSENRSSCGRCRVRSTARRCWSSIR